MHLRELGRSGLHTAPIVFGGNVFGWTADKATSFVLLDAFVAGGFNCIDTADVYSRWAPGHSGGESETIIGEWLKQRGRRDDVIIATKVGSDMGDGRKGLSRAYIMQAAEASLRRLQTDHIDLYQEHFDDEAVPVTETMEAFAALVKQGKVRALGASNITPARLRESLAIAGPRYETLQPHYNLMERAGYEHDYEPICREHGLGVIPYFALAAGFLTGKYRNEADLAKSPRGQGVKK
jgi:aryl-alcohol dehydrogenase-like predicted oxidoreductase